MKGLLASLKELWSRLSRLDLLSIAIAAGGAVLAFVGWWRTKLLWSLRNRLIVAYLFIAVVPVLLIVALAWIAGSQLYSQVGAYLLHEDIQRRIEMIGDITEHIAAAHGTLPPGVTQEESERILAAQSRAVHDRELPGLLISFSDDSSLLRRIGPSGSKSFVGLLQQANARDNSLSLISLRVIQSRGKERLLTLRVPVTGEFLADVAPDLGAIQLNLMERSAGGVQ